MPHSLFWCPGLSPHLHTPVSVRVNVHTHTLTHKCMSEHTHTDTHSSLRNNKAKSNEQSLQGAFLSCPPPVFNL